MNILSWANLQFSYSFVSNHIVHESIVNGSGAENYALSGGRSVSGGNMSSPLKSPNHEMVLVFFHFGSLQKPVYRQLRQGIFRFECR
jgi:hypothetical protein